MGGFMGGRLGKDQSISPGRANPRLSQRIADCHSKVTEISPLWAGSDTSLSTLIDSTERGPRWNRGTYLIPGRISCQNEVDI